MPQFAKTSSPSEKYAKPQLVSLLATARAARSANSSQHDFDFHVGSWKIHNRLLTQRLKNSNRWIEFESTCETRKILNGFGNINEYRFDTNAMPFDAGIVLRLFNPKTRLWTINWADSDSAELDVPVIGFFKEKIGTFLSNDSMDNQPIVVRAVYDFSAADKFIWTQEFSGDNGESFETNWIMTGKRDK